MRGGVKPDLADKLVDEAWEAYEERHGSAGKLALRALQADPDAFDGYVILGHVLDTQIEKIAFLREGVRRGKIYFRDEIKQRSRSRLWDLSNDGRSFMRAVSSLTKLLWGNGDQVESIALAKLMLHLNRDDNQGARYLLLAWLPVIGDWMGFERILKRYSGEGRTEYLYSVCLNAFRKKLKIEDFLHEALARNRHVPNFIANKKLRPSGSIEAYASFAAKQGDQDEAYNYAHMNRAAWASVPGAIPWLKRSANAVPKA